MSARPRPGFCFRAAELLVSGSRFQVPGFWFQVPGFRFLVLFFSPVKELFLIEVMNLAMDLLRLRQSL